MVKLFHSYYKKIIVLTLLLSLVPVIIISSYVYFDKVNTGKDNLVNRLVLISTIGADNTANWVKERQQGVLDIATNQVVIKETKNILYIHQENILHTAHGSDESFKSRFNLERQLAISLNKHEALEELVISNPLTGDVIFYTRLTPPRTYLGEKHFEDAANGKIGMSEVRRSEQVIKNEYGKYERGTPTLLISAPIVGEVGLEGVLTARVNIFKIDPRVQSHIDDLTSAEGYLVNDGAYFLSKSANPEKIRNLIQKRPELELRIVEPTSQQVTQILQKARSSLFYRNEPVSDIDGYRNYLGEPVVGSIAPVSGTNWYFIVEIARDEAYQEITRLQSILLSSFLVLAGITALVSVLFSNNLLNPIKKLTKTIAQFHAREDNPRTDFKRKESINEIEKLEFTFNEMSQRILENESNLNKVIYERTKELENQTKQLEGANIELKSIDKQKDEFASMVTHELKTPLTPIIGWCQALRSPKIMGELTPKQIQAIDDILKNAKRLQTLIGDVLDAEKLDMNKMMFDYNDVDVYNMMDYIFRNLQATMEPKKIQFINSIKEKLIVKSDRNRIEQVLNNLILNAVDFVPEENGEIEMGAQSEDHSVLFCVKDNGLGVSSEKQKGLFKKFYQVDTSARRKHGGTGLGLSICKGIVESLGGKIWVESELGKGSNFYFTIPKEKEHDNNGG